MRPSPRRLGRGFTYWAVLLLVALTSAGSAALAQMWHTAAQRERERELLAIGAEFRAAIGRYVNTPGAARRQHPRTLEELVQDTRQTATQRHLRRIYVDPMTGRAEWGLVRAADGGIAGVHSLSPKRPFKRADFAPDDAAFADSERYADWRFVHRENALRPPAGPVTPGRRSAGAPL